MKKRILAVIAALAIMSVGTTAFAAGSPVAGTTKEDTAAAGQVAAVETQKPTATVEEMAKATTIVDAGADVTVKAVASTTVDEAVTAAKNAVLDLKELSKVTKDASLATAATNEKATVTATVLSVVNIESTATNKTLTVKNAAIKADKTYVVLHYTANGWITLPATAKDGELTFTADNFSPFAIVEVGVKADKATTTTTTATDEKKDEAASPKTGETAPVAVLALLVCAAGIVVCSKKSEEI